MKNPPTKHYKSIFISDLHLGTKQSKAEELLEFIKEYESENLYLVGDIIDGWAMKQKVRWKQSHSDVIQKILRAARKGTNVYYVTGNHDEFLRSFLLLLMGDNLRVVNDIDYHAIDGKKHFVTHGDIFDTMTISKKWLTIFGVICGHIHKADIKRIEGVDYMNTGDWVESCTALVETFEGKWEIIKYRN